MFYLFNFRFSNWADTVHVNNAKIYEPPREKDAMAKEKVQELVRNNQGSRFRVAQYAHTWQNFFCGENDYVISFHNSKSSKNSWEVSYDNHFGDPIEDYHDFWGISKVGSPYKLPGDDRWHHLVKVGSACSSNDLRRWSLEQYEKLKGYPENKAWSVPANILMIQNSVGGTINMMCHGSGVHSKSVADTVVAMEFINAKGDLQCICDINTIKLACLGEEWEKEPLQQREILKKVVGNFGLMGIATYYYIQMDEMQYARYFPKAVEANLAVPNKHDSAEVKAAFEKEILENHYNEYFLYPGVRVIRLPVVPNILETKTCLINNWRTEPITEEQSLNATVMFPNFASEAKQLGLQNTIGCISPLIKDFIDQIGAHKEHEAENFVSEYFPKLLQNQLVVRGAFNWLLGQLALNFLKTPEKLVPDCDALHPARGIQLVPMYDMEVEIPIAKIGDTFDWDVVYSAWWEAEKLAYKIDLFSGLSKVHLPIVTEMRIYGGSDVLMSPAKGNDLTLAIEILTFKDLIYDEDDEKNLKEQWNELEQNVFDTWSNIKDHRGDRLKVVPHWAKQWKHLTYDGEPIMDKYMRPVYGKRVPEFKSALSKVAQCGGYTLKEMVGRFSNNMIDDILALGD